MQLPFESSLESLIESRSPSDVAHDLAHIRRVVEVSRHIAQVERARLEIVIPAAWLHDLVSYPKDSPLRSQSSRESAKEALQILRRLAIPEEVISDIQHAIEAHSFSAGVKPETLEARVLQDADRIDALGAHGLARCLQIGVETGRALYDTEDPFARRRKVDDGKFVIDHFFTKLLHLPDTMNTEEGRRIARDRAMFLREFLSQLEHEISFSRSENFFAQS